MNDAEADLTRETREDWEGPLPLTLRQNYAVGAVLMLARVRV